MQYLKLKKYYVNYLTKTRKFVYLLIATLILYSFDG